MANTDTDANLKQRTARSIKWNVVDRVLTQVLYAVTGIVLARVLSKEDFGLVGAVLVFQAFANLFIDSGFSSALLQRKAPTRLDYSTILWFNIAMAIGIYIILWFCAPIIAWCFQGDERLIPLSRVMFLTLIINASSIVQANRLMKKMDVKMIAISNTIGLILSAFIGIYMAVTGWGAWSIVWQSITLMSTKSIILWLTSHWYPLFKFSWASLKSFFAVGSGMMLTSFLNTVFLNIYSFIIGNRIGLVSLAYYTQSDKWSKMGITSITQTLTISFLPVLSEVQDNIERLKHIISKINRFTAYVLFPAIGFLISISTPIFHALFGTKWDPSILLFQMLLFRGLFTTLCHLYNNYILALGHSKLIFAMEILRDSVAIIALVITFPYMTLTTDTDPVLGIKILLIGQIIASVLTWGVTLYYTARKTDIPMLGYIRDCIPYLVITLITMATLYILSAFECNWNPFVILIVNSLIALAMYMFINFLLKSKIQQDVLMYILGRFRNKKHEIS